MARTIAIAALLMLAPGVASAQVAPDSLPGDPGGQTDNPIVIKPKPAQVPSVMPPKQPDPGPPATIVEPDAPLLVGVHVAAARTSVAFAGNPSAGDVGVASGPKADAGYGPWFDVEAGGHFAPRIALLAFGGYTFDTGNTNTRYQHLVLGVRAQYALTPWFWISGGIAAVREHAAAAGDVTGAPMTDVNVVWSPGAEMRAGLQVWRAGNLGFDVVFDGFVFRREANAFFSSFATLGIGAQWR